MIITTAVVALAAIVLAMLTSSEANRATRWRLVGAAVQPGPASAATTLSRQLRRWRYLTHRQPRVSAAQWADALNLISRAVRSGETLRAAITGLAPWAEHPPLAHLADRLATGAPTDEAVEAAFATSTGSGTTTTGGDAELVAAVLRVSARHGGAVAAALDATAATLMERAAATEDRHVSASQARISSQVLSVLPIAVAIWTLATDARARRVWMSGAAGPTLLVVGLGFNAFGWWWMRRIVRTS